MTTDECIAWLENEGTNYDGTPNLYTTEFLECAIRLRELDAENADRDRRLKEIAHKCFAYHIRSSTDERNKCVNAIYKLAKARAASRPRPALAQLSAEAKAAREPLPPEDLIDAQHDRVHREHGLARAACTVRNKRREPLDAESRDKCTIERLERELAEAKAAMSRCLLGDPPGDCYAAESITQRARAERYRKAIEATLAHWTLDKASDNSPLGIVTRHLRDALGDGDV